LGRGRQVVHGDAMPFMVLPSSAEQRDGVLRRVPGRVAEDDDQVNTVTVNEDRNMETVPSAYPTGR
jgi:hypothetical protein